MSDFSLRWVEFTNEIEAKKALYQIGCSEAGVSLMAGKALGLGLKLEKVPTRAANILKQEMLAADGDAAVHCDVVVNKIEESDVLLLGTVRQFRHVARKLSVQPFGLKELGMALERLIQTLEPPAQRSLDCRGKKLILGEQTLVMGILNLTPDSFSDGGRFFKLEDAVVLPRVELPKGRIFGFCAESTDRASGVMRKKYDGDWKRFKCSGRNTCTNLN